MLPKMWRVVVFLCALALVVSRTESCFRTGFVQVEVPQMIQPGYRIPKVDVSNCLRKSATLTLTDSNFAISGAGKIEVAAPMVVSPAGRVFSVSARDSGGATSHLTVRLICAPPRDGRKSSGEVVLRRFKRRWSPPPYNLLENDKGPFPKYLETLESEVAANNKVYYTISGPGYNQHPVNVFKFDSDTGKLSALKTIDREEFPSFTLTVRVFERGTNKELDDPLPYSIVIDDMNDNAPTFTGPLQVTVLEKSKAGTTVGKINATDRDQPGTNHVKIRYTLLDGLNLFSIQPNTGVITTVTDSLDRETKDKYLVTVKIQDMAGASSGLSNTGTATIVVGDINDNPPTFTETSYDASVKENEIDKFILRIPVNDKDLENTPNWVSKFEITKGNENGNFRVETDPKTNGALLYVSKALDHEKAKTVALEITARNEAELSGTSAGWNSIPVNLNVLNVDEGPEFSAPNITFNVKENIPNNTLIGRYSALDPETKSSNGITYYKVSEPAAWVNVDRQSGDLKVANTIDRESMHVKDGKYSFTMKAVDAASKSSTGTVILVIEDVNDNKPTLPSAELLICEKEGERGSTVVVAEDKDAGHFSAPFSFSLPPDNDGKWSLESLNGTAAVLKQVKDLPRRVYEVDIDVKDLQSNGGIQTVSVRVCQCRNGACMAQDSSSSLGSLGWLALLLPLALLLLLCLLVAFLCVMKKEKLELEDAGDGGGILLKSNTEAPGEEVDSSLITVPPFGGDAGAKGTLKGNTGTWGSGQGSFGQGTLKTGVYKSGITNDIQDFYSSQYDNQYGTQQFNQDYFIDGGMGGDGRYLAQNSSFHHTWQTNGRYLQQKLPFLGTQEDERYAEDAVHDYRFEGVGSEAGSVGCCSGFGDDNDLGFLNTLGPKFKTLANVCRKT
ncbi:desmocollin-2-like [Takifugu rubripes]|uniref:Desmocollin 1 n=1 Tax=Takifugu rubripes TaxID=31033 RepID=H2T0T0_TAKRU|nr:desmocollin-2-like [Takifugu rubripes]